MLFIFRLTKILGVFYFIFALSSQTEASSAGEQLVRDNLDVRQKFQSREAVMVSFDIFRELYAFKNSSMNFCLCLIDSPL